MECTNWSVQIEVYELECTNWSVQIEVYELKCTNWSVQIEVYELECTNWIVQIEVYKLECRNWSVQIGVYKLKFIILWLQFDIDKEPWFVELALAARQNNWPPLSSVRFSQQTVVSGSYL